MLVNTIKLILCFFLFSGCSTTMVLLGSRGISRIEGDKIVNEIDVDKGYLFSVSVQVISETGTLKKKERDQGFVVGQIEEREVIIVVKAVGPNNCVYGVRAFSPDGAPDLSFAKSISHRIYHRAKNVFENY